MKKLIPLLTMVATAALVYLSYASYITNSQLKELIKENKILEASVETSLKAIDTRLTGIARMVNKGRNSQLTPGQNLELEREANIELGKIQDLLTKNNTAQAKTDLDKFLKKYSSTRAAGRARRISQELSVIGKNIPKKWGIEKWLQGKNDISLSSRQGMTLLIFWEEWCGYCRKEMPESQALFAEYKDKGLEVVGVTKINRSATLEKVTAFLKENKIQFPIAKEDGSISEYFEVQGIPASALISNGKIVWRGHPARLPLDMINKGLGTDTK